MEYIGSVGQGASALGAGGAGQGGGGGMVKRLQLYRLTKKEICN